jgi:predicted HTH transcriptional regulator
MIHNYHTPIDKENINIEENIPINVPVNLTKGEKQILELMKNNDTITIHELSTILNLNGRTIRRDIALLKINICLFILGLIKMKNG